MTELQLPRFTNWLLPDDGLEIIGGLIDQHQPRLMLEVGSGRSTIVLAARMAGVGRLVSLEHQERFVDQGQEYLSLNELAGEVRHAPIDHFQLPDGENVLWYARGAWEDLHSIDLLLVDGPIGATAPQARYPALPLLQDRLAPGAVVILDDSHRRTEKQILVRWGLRDLTQVLHSGGALSWGYAP